MEDEKKVSKAQQKAVAKYMKINYDEIKLRVPKGRKTAIQEYASTKGESTNAFLNRLVNQEMGIPTEEPTE